MYAFTMKGIHHWHERTFEKLGWMVLAKAKGYDYKIETYKKSIDHLLKTIDHVEAEYRSLPMRYSLKGCIALVKSGSAYLIQLQDTILQLD